MDRRVVSGARWWLCFLLAWCAQGWAGEPLRIGAEDDWAPYSSAADGKPVGFAVDLVRAAWAAAGVPVELVSLPYARCMKQVDRGVLAGCFDTLRDVKTEPQYRWHQQPLFKARIGTTHGYDYGVAFDADKSMLRDVAPSDLSSLRKLVAGRVDYALVYDRVANQIAKNHTTLGKGFELQGILVEPHIYISFARNYPGIERIVSQFDEGLAIIRRSGEYARIEARWR